MVRQPFSIPTWNRQERVYCFLAFTAFRCLEKDSHSSAELRFFKSSKCSRLWHLFLSFLKKFFAKEIKTARKRIANLNIRMNIFYFNIFFSLVRVDGVEKKVLSLCYRNMSKRHISYQWKQNTKVQLATEGTPSDEANSCRNKVKEQISTSRYHSERS